MVATYKSLFNPHLNYGSLLWGHNFVTTVSNCERKFLEPLQIVHILPTQNLF